MLYHYLEPRNAAHEGNMKQSVKNTTPGKPKRLVSRHYSGHGNQIREARQLRRLRRGEAR